MESPCGSGYNSYALHAPGSGSKAPRRRRHNSVRNWTAAAILLLTLPTFAFITCEIYTQLTAGRSGDSRSGLRIGLRVRDAKKPGSRRSLVDRQAAVTGQDAAEEGIWPPNALSSTSSSIMEAAAAQAPPMNISITVMTPKQFVEGFNGSIANCTWRGRPLDCAFRPYSNDSGGHAAYLAADAIFYHAPELCSAQWFNARKNRVRKAHAGQLAIMMSMESVGYYECFNNPAFMAEFDFEMSYRLDSQLPITYLREDQMEAWMHDPGVPFEERSDAPVYVQSNCITPSRRDVTVSHLMKFKDLGVKSYGRCLNTEGSINGTDEDKVAIYRRHKVCLILENSIAPDYVTEKLYDAFAGGCVPVYYGATNIQDFLPDPESIVDFRQFSSVAAVHDEILRLTHDKAAWEAKVAWRRRPVQELPAPYRKLVEAAQDDSAQCQLCAALADYKAGNTSEVDAFHKHWGWSDAPPPKSGDVLLNALMGF